MQQQRTAEQWENDVREALEVWAAWLRDLPGVGLATGSCQYCERMPGASGGVVLAENVTAERMDRVLCQVKRASLQSYRVLYWVYYYEASTRQVADEMGLTRARVRELKVIGEAMAATLWCSGFGSKRPAA